MAEVFLGIEHLHKYDIIYRDLKPANVVIDKDGHALIIDFGLSKEGITNNGKTTSFCGSRGYLAPEMLKRCGYGKSIDFYHLGILLFEMLLGYSPCSSQIKLFKFF